MSLNIKFENHPESAVPFELIPMLTIGNTYDGKESFPPEETTELVGRISKLKSHVQDKHGNWWTAFNHSKGLTVYVRQLELAKLLHLHNAHLVRAAFRPSGLASMAHVESIQETTIIRFSTLADYPASNLNYQRERVHLAWLYLDDDASRSFESIYRYMQGRSEENWHFQFDPPPMEDWTLRARGYFTKRGDFIVESIKQIEHPGLLLQQNVIFKHPRYKKMIPVFEQGDTGAANNPKIDELDLNINQRPGLNKRVHRQSDGNSLFVIANSYQTDVDGPKQRAKSGSLEEGDKTRGVTSPGHGEFGGEGPEFDYGINRGEDKSTDEDLKDTEVTPRFRLFEKVVAELSAKKGYSLQDARCVAMPSSTNGNTTYKRTVNGQPLSCHIAVINYQGKTFVIVEVNTSSLTLRRSLGTLIVVFASNANESLKQILIGCSNNAVKWDIGLIKKHSLIYNSCRHPNRNKKPLTEGELTVERREDKEIIDSWVVILDRYIREANK